MRGTSPVEAGDVAGQRFRYLEGTCTEGVLDMSVRGFAETLVAHEVPGGLMFVFDRTFGADECAQTVRLGALRTTDPSAGAHWSFREHARVSFPDSDRCEHLPQEDVLGEVRARGSRLELSVRRAAWCNGLEARLVYDPLPATADEALQPAEALRHFVAAFHDRDSLALADLYAPSGVHEDPHRPDTAGRPTLHRGRDVVAGYFTSVFHQVPWLAFRLRDARVEPATAHGTEDTTDVHATVEYMDPRLTTPRLGRLDLQLVAGRIVTSRLELALDAAAADRVQPRP
ncbi:MAG: nuclear transport factor 2 family protein [Polyangiales bacterium]|nr:nuclear transport factor 2 family protein [Myxococcales bacterium]MCB9659105.1 nuclear transport factor 2 family protein [Sandaracinaceae bacterium]